jgi:hypothetical protein
MHNVFLLRLHGVKDEVYNEGTHFMVCVPGLVPPGL